MAVMRSVGGAAALMPVGVEIQAVTLADGGEEPRVWTVDDVRYWLADAADVLRRVPMPRDALPRLWGSCMPQVVRSASEAYGYTPEVLRPARPSGQDVRRMERAIGWLLWIARDDDRRVVFMRAAGLSLRAVARREGISHEWARRKEARGYAEIVTRLKKPVDGSGGS